MESLKLRTAALLELYRAVHGSGTMPAMEPMLMILPGPGHERSRGRNAYEV